MENYLHGKIILTSFKKMRWSTIETSRNLLLSFHKEKSSLEQQTKCILLFERTKTSWRVDRSTLKWEYAQKHMWMGGLGEWDVLLPWGCCLQLHLPASCIHVSKIPGLLSHTPSGFEATPQAGKFVRSFGWALQSAFGLQVFTWGSLLQGPNSATLAVIKQSLISQSIHFLSGLNLALN